MKRHLAKVLLSALASSGQAQDMTLPQAMSARECFFNALPCTCYNDPAVRKITTGLLERRELKLELERYKKFSEAQVVEKEWYEGSTLFFASVITGVIAGSAIGFAAAK